MKKKKEFVEALTEILVRQGTVSAKEAIAMKENFYGRSKDAFDFFLIDEGLVPRDKLLEALSIYFEVPAIDVRGIFFDHDLLKNFPKDFLLRNEIIPYQVDQDILTVVAGNPNVYGLIAEISQYTDYDIEFLVGEGRDIIDAIAEYYDEPPEGYIHDLTDEDEPENNGTEERLDIDEYIDKEGLDK